jgi:hypothetical protein
MSRSDIYFSVGGRRPCLCPFLALAHDGRLHRGGLLFDLQLSAMDDFDHQLFRVDEHGDALGHLQLRDSELRLDLLERREVDLEGLRYVGRQAFHAHCVDRLQDVRVSALDRG